MKASLHKITYREIRHSIGRFLSIVCIVMLGSGMLYGLRVTRGDMIKTLDSYSVENKFYDFGVISTLGLTDGDVKYFSGLDGVESAEGSVSADAFFSIKDGKSGVMKVHSIPQSMNLLKLREGRLPEAADECVLDALYTDSGAIGKTVTLTDENDADTLGKFAEKTFTVVGLVNSPLYINFTRGTTTLGNGTVGGFIYIPQDAFSTDYFTEAYIRLKTTGGVYTDEYDKAVDAFRDTIEADANGRAMERYDTLVSDANEKYGSALDEYNSGVSEFNAKKADAEKQLSASLTKLNAADKVLAQSRAQLDSGRAQLKNAEAQLKAKREQFDAETASMLAELAASKAQLDGQWAAYNSALEQYNDAVSQYGEAAVQGQKAQLDAMKAQLDAAQTQYDAGAAKIETAKQQLDGAQAELSAKQAELDKGEAQYKAGAEKLKQGRKDYAEADAKLKSSFADAQAKLDDGKASLDDAKDKIASIEKPTVYILDRNSNSGYSSFENDSGIVEGVARIFPMFFFLVAALVCLTTMNRMVDEQRTQIGTLKSLGYTSWEIMRGYLLYTGLASGIGSAAGVAIGGVVFPKIIWMGYNIMYGFTGIELGFEKGLALAVCGSFILCSLLVTWLTCRSELNVVPAELIRQRAPRAGKRILLEKLPFIWNRFSFLKKVSARNIFRYKKRMFMMIIGIAGCMALLLTAFGINDSIAGLADTQFSEVSLYDAQVNFREPMSAGDREDFITQSGGNVSGCAFLSMSSVNADVNGKPKSVYLVGTDEKDMTPFMNFAMDGDVQSYPGDGETIINDNLARILNVRAGDVITLRDSDMNTFSLKVSGIFYNVIYNYAYVNMNTLKAAGFSGDINCAFVNLAGGDVYKAAAAVGASDYVSAVTLSRETHNLFGRSLESMQYIVGLISLCAGALAFIVLYNLTNINITERLREIATIKVLGFRRWETASYVYRENIMLTLMGTAAGIPLGIWLNYYVMSNIRIDMVSYDVKILWPSYIIAIALTIAFAVIVDIFMYPRLDRINMAESLKSVE